MSTFARDIRYIIRYIIEYINLINDNLINVKIKSELNDSFWGILKYHY